MKRLLIIAVIILSANSNINCAAAPKAAMANDVAKVRVTAPGPK